MYVRVEGRRIETCPISGTIRRGADALEDADRILELLNSKKDESELTMCTDVDRNDKSRVCVAGASRSSVAARSRCIRGSSTRSTMSRACCAPNSTRSTGFSSHAWAVTVTGAPKLWAIRFIEQQERSARRWYGGAIGRLTFDGNMNTGLTLRTIRMQDGIGEVRAGAHPAVRQRPRRRGRGMPAKGLGVVRGDRRQPSAGGRPLPSRRRNRVRAAGCCWSTTRIRSSTRSPAMSVRRAPNA